MSTTSTTPMPWSNAGIEPSSTLQTNGFAGGYKPPAEIFNYFLNNSATCFTELQTAVTSLESVNVWIGSGVGAVKINSDNNVASGLASIAAGVQTTASGIAATATGTNTTASGDVRIMKKLKIYDNKIVGYDENGTGQEMTLF